MKFTIGSYAKIDKDNKNLQELGLDDFAGKVIEHNNFLGTYTIQLDAQTPRPAR
jgi:hypothetical protein